jgi:hypothetical protein
VPRRSPADQRRRLSRHDDAGTGIDTDIDIDDGYRYSRQIDRTDSLLSGFNVHETSELPLHEPTGEKTRKTYDFTSTKKTIEI